MRRTAGYDRYEVDRATQALNRVYAILRLWVNFFQPSQKLESKQRCGSRIRRKYLPAKTSYQRLIESMDLSEDLKRRLSAAYVSLNPISLNEELDRRMEDFWNLAVR